MVYTLLGHTLIPVHAPPPSGNTTRVLCVDDNPDQADSEALFLRVIGFDARACYGGRDAIVMAEVFLPDVCLLDLHMPGMAGGELAARLRDCAGDRTLVVVAVTAADNELAAGVFDRHLIKPVDPARLRTVVDTLAAMEWPSGETDLSPRTEYVEALWRRSHPGTVAERTVTQSATSPKTRYGHVRPIVGQGL